MKLTDKEMSLLERAIRMWCWAAPDLDADQFGKHKEAMDNLYDRIDLERENVERAKRGLEPIKRPQ